MYCITGRPTGMKPREGKTKHVESPLHAFSSPQSKMRPLSFGSPILKTTEPVLNLCNQQHCSTSEKPTTWADATLLRQWTHGKGGGQTGTETRDKNGQHYQTSGEGYTPNNRCRPEAPLTSLPKLTPAKNDEDRKGEGERRNKTRFKKNLRGKGVVCEVGAWLKSNKAGAEQNKCYR